MMPADANWLGSLSFCGDMLTTSLVLKNACAVTASFFLTYDLTFGLNSLERRLNASELYFDPAGCSLLNRFKLRSQSSL